MTQIVCIGASSLYGVGGSRGGWADLLKQEIHSKIYGDGRFEDGKYEVYNFAVPGATVDDLRKRTRQEITACKKPNRKLITIFHIGCNDAKAVKEPDNYVSNVEDYKKSVKFLLEQAVDLSDKVYCCGMGPMDESKTFPKINPWTKKKSFFSNARIQLFENALKQVCEDMDVVFIELFSPALSDGWIDNYLHEDGQHPNDQGHNWLLNKVKNKIQDEL
jgi:lysophospholipase L1-like esterase